MSRSLNEAKVLIKLLEIDTISMSNFSQDKSLIKKLENLDVIKVFKNFGKRGSGVKKGNSFDKYIKTQYNGDIQSFIDIDSRGKLLKKFDDDKAKSIKPQTGIYLWTDDEVNIGDGNIVSCKNGTCLFIHHTTKIEISEEVLIVGIENFETLMNAINIKHFFDKDVKIVFMFRNSSFLKYIKNAKNTIAYFPDYDVYGVKIYETEILKYNQNVTMFVPSSFELDLISVDSKKRYFEDLASKDGKYMAVTEIGKFILKINKNHCKVLAQEFYSVSALNIDRT